MRPLWAVAVIAVACGKPADPVVEEPKLKTLTAAATAGAALMQEELTAEGAVTAVGTSSQGNLVMVAADRVFELTAGELVKKPLYAEGLDPTSLGAVRHVIPRSAGGAYLAAEHGLFVLDGAYVTHSPVMVGMGPLSGASEGGKGALMGLWLAASNGVYRRQTTQTDRYSIEGFGEEAKAIALESDGTAALAVLGGKLVLLTSGAAGLAAELPPEDVGAVNAVAAGKGVLFAATVNGLYRWQSAATPKWSRFTLGGAAAEDVQLDPVTGSVWVQTASDLLRIDGDELVKYARPAGTSLLAVDRLGDLWSAKASTLVRLKAGAGSTDAKFAADLKPWLQTNCIACHADFADPIAFAPRAEAALQRVRIGDMPRCLGGVPCAASEHLKPEQYAVLEGWIRGGKQP